MHNASEQITNLNQIIEGITEDLECILPDAKQKMQAIINGLKQINGLEETKDSAARVDAAQKTLNALVDAENWLIQTEADNWFIQE